VFKGSGEASSRVRPRGWELRGPPWGRWRHWPFANPTASSWASGPGPTPRCGFVGCRHPVSRFAVLGTGSASRVQSVAFLPRWEGPLGRGGTSKRTISGFLGNLTALGAQRPARSRQRSCSPKHGNWVARRVAFRPGWPVGWFSSSDDGKIRPLGLGRPGNRILTGRSCSAARIVPIAIASGHRDRQKRCLGRLQLRPW